MIALGILAYGLSMSAGLFAAAVQYNNQSFRDVVGTIICENGATMAQTVLTHSSGLAGSSALEDITDEFELAERTYPADSVDSDGRTSPYGFCVLARQIGDENDYQLTIVSYKLNDLGNSAEMVEATVDISNHEDVSEVEGLPDGVLPYSPIIIANTGELSYVEDVSGGDGILRTRMTGGGGVTVWVLVETENVAGSVTAPTGMAAYTIRTSLPRN
jgi:hypothetical protein